MSGRAICGHPLCDRRLDRESKTGVCREHRCAKPYCRCVTCRAEGAQAQTEPVEREAIATRPDLKQHEIPMGGHGDSTVKVTLKRAPWE